LILIFGESQAEVIINQAKNESLIMIQEAETKQAQINAQTDEISKKAYDEGFQKGVDDGYAKFKEDAKSALISLDSLADTSFDLKKNIIKSADLDSVELGCAISETLFNVKISTFRGSI
jgi:flagellar biosynthesis/type III secretory pathway protein FliH